MSKSTMYDNSIENDTWRRLLRLGLATRQSNSNFLCRYLYSGRQGQHCGSFLVDLHCPHNASAYRSISGRSNHTPGDLNPPISFQRRAARRILCNVLSSFGRWDESTMARSITRLYVVPKFASVTCIDVSHVPGSNFNCPTRGKRNPDVILDTFSHHSNTTTGEGSKKSWLRTSSPASSFSRPQKTRKIETFPLPRPTNLPILCCYEYQYVHSVIARIESKQSIFFEGTKNAVAEYFRETVQALEIDSYVLPPPCSIKTNTKGW